MFPFDAPAGSEVYLALLVATFALHMLLIGFVLAGSAYVLGRAVAGGDDPLAAATRDWLPFALGAAITAGVAPLLMVQVLYQPRFYTANLLLFHRWMAIVPVLVVGFYLLYLGKSARAAAWSRRARAALAAVTLLCFVFVAWSWIENHALAMRRDPADWVTHYASGRKSYASTAVVPRLLLWLGLAGASWAAGVLGLAAAPADRDRRRAAAIALAGLALAALAAAWTHATTDPARTVFDLAPARPWLVVAAAGALGTAAAWTAVLLGKTPPRWPARAAVALLVLGLAATREASRVAALDPALAARLRGAQGLPLFLVTLVAGAAAIYWCLVVVRRHLAAR